MSRTRGTTVLHRRNFNNTNTPVCNSESSTSIIFVRIFWTTAVAGVEIDQKDFGVVKPAFARLTCRTKNALATFGVLLKPQMKRFSRNEGDHRRAVRARAVTYDVVGARRGSPFFFPHQRGVPTCIGGIWRIFGESAARFINGTIFRHF